MLSVEDEVLEEQLEQAYPNEAMVIASGLLSLGHSGQIRFEAGLVRPEDIPAETLADSPAKAGRAPDTSENEDAGDPNASECNGDVRNDEDAARWQYQRRARFASTSRALSRSAMVGCRPASMIRRGQAQGDGSVGGARRRPQFRPPSDSEGASRL